MIGRVFLVRHGRTSLDAAGRLRSRLDPPLDEVGLGEAAAVAAGFGSGGS
jgi:broad specificity phosphatase PhoE